MFFTGGSERSEGFSEGTPAFLFSVRFSVAEDRDDEAMAPFKLQLSEKRAARHCDDMVFYICRLSISVVTLDQKDILELVL